MTIKEQIMLFLLDDSKKQSAQEFINELKKTEKEKDVYFAIGELGLRFLDLHPGECIKSNSINANSYVDLMMNALPIIHRENLDKVLLEYGSTLANVAVLQMEELNRAINNLRKVYDYHRFQYDSYIDYMNDPDIRRNLFLQNLSKLYIILAALSIQYNMPISAIQKEVNLILNVPRREENTNENTNQQETN